MNGKGLIVTRSTSKAILAAAAALSLFFAPAAAADKDLGEQLIRAFFEASGKGDHAAVERTLAQGFQAVHTNGVSDRQEELDLIRNMKLGSTTLTDFKTTQNGPALVVTFKVNAPDEVLGGKSLGEGTYERMAVWLDTDSGWQLIAYANLAPLKD